ncbi:MAG: cobalt-zinc-cadmium efflux system membrane fusion protein, partial [Pseudoalteromonas tetraodonis]
MKTNPDGHTHGRARRHFDLKIEVRSVLLVVFLLRHCSSIFKSKLRLLPLVLAAATAASAAEEAITPERAANTIILDETGVKNLRIETVEVDEQDFESTVFAIGRIEEIPAKRSVLSSRISGRAIKVNAFEGDRVEKGQVLVEVESRQPGNPPPIISLRANQAGLVISSHVRVGEPVQPDTELLDISDRSEMWAIAKIPEKEAVQMKIGTVARIAVHAIGGEPIVAELTRFGIEADRKAGTVDGIFRIQNPEGKLQPGMRTEFAIITSTREDVMAVPRTAVQGDPTKRVVYVKDFDLENAFVRAPVVLGEKNEQWVEVINGLFPGDEVVTQGSYSLGFAGGGSISLKDALDAAHGHEHNEDGSELTPAQKAAEDAEKAAAAGGGGGGEFNPV